MRVVVLVKQVPDIVSERALGGDGLLVRGGADQMLNELDEGAIETALRSAVTLGAEVIAVTMGPDGAASAARKALQVGAASAIHISDPALAGSDAVVTARVLAAAIRLVSDEDPGNPVALVVAGMSALDGLGSVVPALVAAELDWPVISFANSVELSAAPAQITVTRETEHGSEHLRSTLPAVVSVTDTIAQLRVPSFASMLAARKATLRVLTAADLGFEAAQVGLAGSRATIVASAPRPPRPAPQVVQDSGQGAAALVDFLDQRGLLEAGA